MHRATRHICLSPWGWLHFPFHGCIVSSNQGDCVNGIVFIAKPFENWINQWRIEFEFKILKLPFECHWVHLWWRVLMDREFAKEHVEDSMVKWSSAAGPSQDLLFSSALPLLATLPWSSLVKKPGHSCIAPILPSEARNSFREATCRGGPSQDGLLVVNLLV